MVVSCYLQEGREGVKWELVSSLGRLARICPRFNVIMV